MVQFSGPKIPTRPRGPMTTLGTPTELLSPLEWLLLELLQFDGVYPNEGEVLEFIKGKLTTWSVDYQQDAARNLFVYMPGGAGPQLALVGHVDIAAPLNG